MNASHEWEKPSRTNRRQKRKWRRKNSCLTLPRAAFENISVPAHVGAGRRNPIIRKAHKRQIRALFVCPEIVYGGLGGAGSRLAGILTSRFSTPVQAVTIPASKLAVAAPFIVVRSHP